MLKNVVGRKKIEIRIDSGKIGKGFFPHQKETPPQTERETLRGAVGQLGKEHHAPGLGFAK